MNHRNARRHLDSHEGLAHGLANVLRMGRFASQYYTQANNRIQLRLAKSRQLRGYYGDFKSPRNAHDLDRLDFRLLQTNRCRAEHPLYVSLIITRGHNGKVPADGFGRTDSLNFFQHWSRLGNPRSCVQQSLDSLP